tara:strand:+ start:34 stop:390 length:357 start_codon:yes stop_codon:yes gene_type:complete
MPDYNQNKPGESLTKMSEQFRKQNLVKNVYPVSDSDGYSANHPNALANGDDRGRGNSIYLDVFGEDIGTRTDIMGNGEANTGRINNLKTNLYGKDNEYSAGNIDSGPGFETKTSTPPA